jgi:hypothetical protein
MSHLRSARLFVVTMVAVTLAACSGQSPVAPDQLSSAKGGGTGAKPSTGVTGVYALTFYAQSAGTYEEVSSLPVYSPGVLPAELQLKAQVTDPSGNPATTGTVTFDYCSYGKPTDYITDPDEAPKEACEQGTATWVQLRRALRVSDAACFHLGGGSACTYFSVVRIPRTVGFRFRYAQQGSSIASGTSPARNFVWVAQQ